MERGIVLFKYIIKNLNSKHSESYFLLAKTYAQLGEEEEVLDHLKLAIDSGFKGQEEINKEQVFDQYRDREDFREILTKMAGE